MMQVLSSKVPAIRPCLYSKILICAIGTICHNHPKIHWHSYIDHVTYYCLHKPPDMLSCNYVKGHPWQRLDVNIWITASLATSSCNWGQYGESIIEAIVNIIYLLTTDHWPLTTDHLTTHELLDVGIPDGDSLAFPLNFSTQIKLIRMLEYIKKKMMIQYWIVLVLIYFITGITMKHVLSTTSNLY